MSIIGHLLTSFQSQTLSHDAYTSYPTRAGALEIPGHGDSGPRGEARAGRSVTGPDAGLEDLGDGHDLPQRRRQCHPGPWAHGLDESFLGALPDRERLLEDPLPLRGHRGDALPLGPPGENPDPSLSSQRPDRPVERRAIKAKALGEPTQGHRAAQSGGD